MNQLRQQLDDAAGKGASLALRSNHYERAFEHYLRTLRATCIPVDETRRTFTSRKKIKSLDFILLDVNNRPLCVDVKGRSLLSGAKSMQTWATEEDIRSLTEWKKSFGREAVGLFAFVYLVSNEETARRFEDFFESSNHWYGCLTVDIESYRALMKQRSKAWHTIDVSQVWFRSVAKPLTYWLNGGE